MSDQAIPLQALLAACFSAASLAGEIIREVVHQSIDLQLISKDPASYDPQTIADRRAQQRIVYALRQCWPHLQIVGEEGDLGEPTAPDQLAVDLHVLDTALGASANTEQLASEDVVVWIDPLDGTKRFAAQQYEQVSVLIGIAYQQRPLAGIVHLPFHGDVGITFWGGRTVGIFRSAHQRSDADIKQAVVTHEVFRRADRVNGSTGCVLTRSATNCEFVNDVVKELKPHAMLQGGATGTLALTVVKGDSDVFLRFRHNTKRWDLCAVEPLVEAVGGSVVDRYGRAYRYDPHGPPEYDNYHGFVITANDGTKNTVLEAIGKVDMLRTLDGSRMTKAWMEEHIANGETVEDVNVVFAQRGKQSAVARVVLTLGNSTTGHNTHQRSVFIKRYVKDELPDRCERRWARDLYSYQCEARFYREFYRDLQAHVPLVHPVAVFMEKPDEGKQAGSAFMVVLEDVQSPVHHSRSAQEKYVHADCLDSVDIKAALSFLAKLHSIGGHHPELVQRAHDRLWSSGGWWSLQKRGLAELSQAPRVWAQVQDSFASFWQQHGFQLTESQRSLAQRMVDHAEYIHAQLFGDQSGHPMRDLCSIIHGDFKSANLFFECSSRSVIAVDWQWCGVGLGALDVANLLNTSASIDALEGEQGLLQFYFEEWRAHDPRVDQLQYNFKEFERHYELALLEYSRVLISNFWDDMTPASCEAKAGKTNWGLGYRSTAHVQRLIQKMDNALSLVEREKQVSSA